MIIIDTYIMHFVVATPLLAALFITLIPAADTSSKLAMSKFFSLAGFIFFLRLGYLYFNNLIPAQHVLSINLTQFNINLVLSISKQNIFLFGALSMSLLADMFFYEFNDTKSNMHQVAPFLLTFILFVSLGQKDIRVALPIISVANFIIYFIIGHNNKKNRGTAIFQTGIFILTVDALSLVLLQFQAFANSSATIAVIMQIAIILPGLTRLCLPLCAPFMNTLFLNLDESEGPFILIFLHIAGFFILFLTYQELGLRLEIASIIIGIASVLSALYISFVVIYEKKISVIPYYFLVFYSAFANSIIFIFDMNISWYISATVFLTSIAVFMHAAKSASIIEKYRYVKTHKSKLLATWFLSLCLLMGIPGLGIGTVVWAMLYLMHEKTVSLAQPYNALWSGVIFSWVIAIFILAYAFLSKASLFSSEEVIKKDQFVPMKKSFLFSPIIIAVLSFIIPLLTLYASSKIMK